MSKKTFKEYIGGNQSTYLGEDKEDDELLRIDVANAFIEKFASEHNLGRANLQSQMVGDRQMIKVYLGRGTSKTYVGQLIVEYSSRDKYKIKRHDGLFQTNEMKKWSTREFDRVFKTELKKGKIR